MPSTTDSEFASLVAQFGPGLSLQDMRMKQLGGPTTPGKSTTDLEYAYFASQGGSASNSRSDNESKYWPGNNSLSDDKFTAGSVVTKVRTNLALNPGYEVGTKSIYSNEGTLYVLSTDTVSPIAGTKSALTTRSATGPSTVVSSFLLTPDTALPFPIVAGTSLMTCGISIKTDVAGLSIYTGMYWYDGVGALTVGSQTMRVIGTVANQVYRVVENSVPPVGTAKAYFVINVFASGNAVAGSKVWADQLTIEYGTTDGSYFDGDVPDTFTMDYAWTGTPNDSTSTATSKIVPSNGYTNFIINPTPTSITGWGSNDPSMWALSYAANEVIANRQAASVADFAASLSSLGITTINPVLPLGTKYQRSVEIWTDLPNASLSASSGYTADPTVLTQNTWTRVVQQFTGTGVAAYVTMISVYAPGVGTGVHVKFRKSQLIENPSGHTIPYFDGSTPDEFTMDYAWTGAANNSTSTATQKVMPSGGYTNLCTNPTPGSITGWDSNYPADFIQTYAANEISVNRQATAIADYVSSNFTLGNINFVVLPAGVKYQRSVEIWTDLPGAVVVGGIAGAFDGNNFPLVAGSWTRIVEQFPGSGASQSVMGINVFKAGYAGTGIHVKFRKAQLIENPAGHTIPYFDGTTPDTSSIDFAWTGAPNGSTSTAKPIGS